MPRDRGCRLLIVRRDEMQLRLQLQWRRQPALLLQLLQRPVWLDAWMRGEEERVALLWSRLPNRLILKILEMRTISILSCRVEAYDAQLGGWCNLPSLESILRGCHTVRGYDRYGLLGDATQLRLRRRLVSRLALAEGRVALLRPPTGAERRPCDGSDARWSWLLWP